MVKRALARSALAGALLLIGCGEQTVAPGTECFLGDETCSELQACVSSRCLFTCDVEGDCDPGYHCVEGACHATCTGPNQDCPPLSACVLSVPEREIMACLPLEQTYCFSDSHCVDTCNRGECTIRCNDDRDCGPGVCGPGDRGFLVCIFHSF